MGRHERARAPPTGKENTHQYLTPPRSAATRTALPAASHTPHQGHQRRRRVTDGILARANWRTPYRSCQKAPKIHGHLSPKVTAVMVVRHRSGRPFGVPLRTPLPRPGPADTLGERAADKPNRCSCGSDDQSELPAIRARSRLFRELSVSGWSAPSTRSRSARVRSYSGIAWSSVGVQPQADAGPPGRLRHQATSFGGAARTRLAARTPCRFKA